MRTEVILETILLRDSYRSQRIAYLRRLIVGVAVLLAASMAGNWVLVSREPIFRYLLTDKAGEIVDLVPMHLPKHEEEFVAQWTLDAVIQAYSFDFVNARAQLQAARSKMTGVGWANYEDALRSSGNYEAVMRNQYATTAVPLAQPRVVETGTLLGRYAWRVEIPMLVTYQSSSLRTNQELKVTAIVIRQPEYLQPEGLGLRQIIAE